MADAATKENVLSRMNTIQHVVAHSSRHLRELAKEVLFLRVDVTHYLLDDGPPDLEERMTALEKKLGIAKS